MKTIQILEDCLHKGKHLEARTVLKGVPNDEAADLVTSGRAIEVREPHTVRGPAPAVEHRDPVVETRDPEPAATEPEAAPAPAAKPSRRRKQK